jgi:hypothetical protein
MSKFATLVAKLKVILKAAPTWIITAALIAVAHQFLMISV